MGTRCLFKVYDFDNKPICTIYKHFSGNPNGEPFEVAKFIAKRKLTNGIGDDWRVFNGMDDLAAQIVTFLKLRHVIITKILESKKRKSKERTLRIKEENIEDAIIGGEVYILPNNIIDAFQEYEYHIKPEKGEIIIEAYYVRRIDEKRLIFKGTAEEFVEYFSSTYGDVEA